MFFIFACFPKIYKNNTSLLAKTNREMYINRDQKTEELDEDVRLSDFYRALPDNLRGR